MLNDYELRVIELSKMSYNDLIDYIIKLEDEISYLNVELVMIQNKYSNKISKDYEDNRQMVADLLKGVVNKDEIK